MLGAKRSEVGDKKQNSAVKPLAVYRFKKSQTLIKFVEKYINIYNTKFIKYELHLMMNLMKYI